jgi:hypothetical protein
LSLSAHIKLVFSDHYEKGVHSFIIALTKVIQAGIHRLSF